MSHLQFPTLRLAILLLVQSAYLTQSFLAGDLAIPGRSAAMGHTEVSALGLGERVFFQSPGP